MGTSMDTPRLLLVDNYDSFTYNLVQAFLVLGADVLVHRNDAITVEEARRLAPTHPATSPSSRCSAARWCGRAGSCTARSRRCTTTAAESSQACRSPSRQAATTR